MIKLAINPETLEIKSNGEAGHYTYLSSKTFDKWVRCIYWPEHKRIYFRFYKPNGDYTFISTIDEKKSLAVCDRVYRSLIRDGKIKKVTPLYWCTDKVIDEAKVMP